MTRWFFVWEIIIFLITSFNFVFIPFDFSFGVTEENIRDIYFHKFSPFIFFTDIAIRFNTSYFHRGYLVKDCKKIIKNYILNLFLADIVTSLSLFSDIFRYEGRYLLFFIRIFYFSKILDKITE